MKSSQGSDPVDAFFQEQYQPYKREEKKQKRKATTKNSKPVIKCIFRPSGSPIPVHRDHLSFHALIELYF